MIMLVGYLQDFERVWGEVVTGRRDAKLVAKLKFCRDISNHVDWTELEFWDDFEKYLWTKLTKGNRTFPQLGYVRHIVGVCRHVEEDIIRFDNRRRTYSKASQYLTISSGIVYITSRLIILVLLFTSLRAVPKGLYENTSWTRFLPTVS